MLRKIIKINPEKCNGCTLCATACHEGAIAMQNGKAVLLRDDYCDGLGNCLPVCPTGAISFETREAAEYNDAAVRANIAAKQAPQPQACACPGSMAKTFAAETEDATPSCPGNAESALAQWPVQLQLVAANAPYWENADILLAADCAAYACGNFHAKFMQRRITVIACPKLDNADHQQKLAQIIAANNIRSITVVRMQVPCCGGLQTFAQAAVDASGKNLPVQTLVLSLQGALL